MTQRDGVAAASVPLGSLSMGAAAGEETGRGGAAGQQHPCPGDRKGRGTWGSVGAASHPGPGGR